MLIISFFLGLSGFVLAFFNTRHTVKLERSLKDEPEPSRALPYRTAGTTDSPALDLDGAKLRQRFVEDERDRWRDTALRYEHALQAIAHLHHAGCHDIATGALDKKRGEP